MVRDLKAGWKSFLAILLISMLSTALFMGLDATWRGMRVSVQRQSALGNLAELWVDGEISDSDARRSRTCPASRLCSGASWRRARPRSWTASPKSSS
jgi:hypothetical protein